MNLTEKELKKGAQENENMPFSGAADTNRIHNNGGLLFMKSRLCFFVIILLGSSNFAAIEIGIKGGLSLYEAMLTFDSHETPLRLYYGIRTGPTLTLFGEIGQNKYLNHNIQFSYYQAGGKSAFDVVNELGVKTGIGWDEIVLSYLGFGYSLKGQYSISTIVPYISLGFSFDYLVDQKERMKVGDKTENIPSFSDVKLNPINFRPLISPGIEYKIGRATILLEYTFSYNILPYYQHAKDSIYVEARHTTSGHLINIGCKYQL